MANIHKKYEISQSKFNLIKFGTPHSHSFVHNDSV
jgi:hypothetical protein